MNFSKKIAAGAVALALGTSAIVAPQARALPDRFTSPPGLELGYAKGCQNNPSLSVEPGQQDRTFEENWSSGLILGTLREEYNSKGTVEVTVWASYTPEGERDIRFSELELEIRNISKNNIDYSVQTLKPGTYPITGMQGQFSSEGRNLVVTDTAEPSAVRGTLARGKASSEDGNQSPTANLKFQDGGKRTYAWKVTLPFNPEDRDAYAAQVRPILRTQNAPWPIENDSCLPLLPSDQTTKPLLADGTEYATGISVRGGAADDYARLTGKVFGQDGKEIAGATVRVDASGKVYATLPKGATGAKDDAKPQQVKVELIANPRDTDSTHDSYRTPQILRVENPAKSGSTNNDQPTFSGVLPIQKFTPAYKDPNAVQPGKTVAIDLAKQPGQVRGKDVAATYTATVPLEGWTVKVDEKTGKLQVTAPKDAKPGTAATVKVTATYPDGSTDTLEPKVTVKDFDSNLNQPGYGEAKDVPGATVTITQTAQLPQGSTFTVVEGQPWNPQVNPTTGEITVTIPAGTAPGTVQEILVDVTYPDGSVDKRVPAKVTVLNIPAYGEVTDKPGTQVTLTPASNTTAPGTTFEITPGQNLGEWKPQIDPATGVITVTIPEGSKTPQTINVTVTDPNDPQNPKTVPAKVTPLVPPVYGEVTTNPGKTVTLIPGKDNVPAGSTFEITPGQDLGAWQPRIDETSGTITVTVPEGEKAGDKTIDVTVTYPGGKTDTVPAKVIVETPTETDTPNVGTVTLVVNPGGQVELTPTIIAGNPGNTTYKIKDGWKAPEGWEITVDPTTGQITVIAPKDAVPGTKVDVPVQVAFPSGKVEDREIVVKVANPTYTIGQKDPFIVYIPKGGSSDKVELPEGWKYTVDGDKIVITVPENVEAGTTPTIRFPRTDGQGYINVQIDLKGNEAAKTETTLVNGQAGSSEDLKKCFDNLSSEGSPLPWLIPAAILLGVGAPLAGAMGPEIGKAIANVSAQVNIDIPNPFAGIGGERRQSAAAAQLQAEIARLQEQFGPAVTQAGAVILALTALAATAGILYAVCTKETPTTTPTATPTKAPTA